MIIRATPRAPVDPVEARKADLHRLRFGRVVPPDHVVKAMRAAAARSAAKPQATPTSARLLAPAPIPMDRLLPKFVIAPPAPPVSRPQAEPPVSSLKAEAAPIAVPRPRPLLGG